MLGVLMSILGKSSSPAKAKQININTVKTLKSNSQSGKQKLRNKKGAMKSLKSNFNFFIAFKVNNIEIHQKVKRLQEETIVKNPLLFPALVNVSTLHVTLAVTYLANEADIKSVKNKLDDWAEKNFKIYFEKPCILSFSGVKTFKNGVAYVDIEHCDNYKKVIDISKSIKNVLTSSGFMVDNKIITPHLTFLKLSKSYELMKSKNKFKEDFEFLKKCKEHFGQQEVHHLQLLSMNEPKNEFGYYECFHEIKVSEAASEVDHTECCIPILKP